MNKKIHCLVFFLIGIIAGFLLKTFSTKINIFLKNEKEEKIIRILPKPLEKYSFENLINTKVNPEKINIGKTLKEEKDFNSFLFSINFDPTLRGKEIKKVTGVINIPEDRVSKKYPAIVMLRGFVDQKIYTSGTGSKRAGEYFAKNGFIAIAPDFLGYGESDKESENIFESRFQTYTTTLSLIASLDSLENWDKKNIFLWAHSNGGHIALAVLEITGGKYPTALWAPVSKPFPYSILYYTDESEDLGKLIRKRLSEFEKDYDVNKFSIHGFLEKINAPLQIHQGGSDDAVPVSWTNQFVKNLKNLQINVKYFTYPGADHNLQPSWNTVILRDLNFFKSNLN